MCRSRHLPVLQKHTPTHQPTHLASRLLRVQLRSRRSLRLQLGTLAHALCKVERCRIGWNVGRASSAARCRAGRPPCEQAALRVVAAAKCRQSITAPYDSCPAPCPSFTHNTHTPCADIAIPVCALPQAHSPVLPLPFVLYASWKKHTHRPCPCPSSFSSWRPPPPAPPTRWARRRASQCLRQNARRRQAVSPQQVHPEGVGYPHPAAHVLWPQA